MKRTATRLYQYIALQKGLILLGILATLLMGLVELFTGSLLKFLTNLIEKFDGSFIGEQAQNIRIPLKYKVNLPLFQENMTIIDRTLEGPDQVFRAMMGLCFLFLGLYFLLVLSNYGRRVFMNAATQKILLHFKGDIYNKLVRLPYFFFGKNKTGDLVSRITYDVTTLSEIIDLFIEVARALIFILIFVPVMFYLSWQLSLFALIFFPLSVVLIGYVTRYIRTISKKLTDNVGDYTAFLEEKINRFKLVKDFGSEEKEKKAFAHLIKSNYQHNLRLIQLKYSMNPSNEFLSMIALSVVFIFYSYRLTKGDASLGDIVFFVYLMRTVYKPVKKVAQAWGQLHMALISTKKIFRLLDNEEEINWKNRCSKFIDTAHTIEFRNVVFQYPDGNLPVIDNLSFNASKGDRIAITGRSGSGKSTLLKLIPAFFTPNSGEILINSIPYEQFGLEELRSVVSHLDSQALLMTDTIRNNIEYSGNGIPVDQEEEFIQFLRLQSKDDLNLTIGNEGLNLSEGQKQKLSFLRAYLARPKILILDEAFGSLDKNDITYFMEKCQDIDLVFLVSRKPEVLQYATKTIALK